MKPIEYADAPPEVRAVFDDIKRTRGVPDGTISGNISRTIPPGSSARGTA
jgi:hypothetical protein